MKQLRFIIVVMLLAVAAGLCATASALGDVDVTGPFQARCADLAGKAEQAGTITVTGQQDWLFFGPELHHISVGPFWGENAAKVSKAVKPEYADPLPAILDFNDQLRKQGVELLMVPVPPKAIIYPDYIPNAVPGKETGVPPRLDTQDRVFYEILEANGIRVLDLVPVFRANRLHQAGPMYCKQDSHWSGNGCVLAAEQIAKEIRGRPWYGGIPKRAFTSEWMKITISGDLWKALDNKELRKEELQVRRVGTPSESGLQPVEPNKVSPIVLLGDSHDLVFHSGADMHARQAGLADQLALELGFPVDLVAVRGSGATPARINLLRKARKEPSYWAGKKIVIWCFSAREFTESDGWRKVPIVQ